MGGFDCGDLAGIGPHPDQWRVAPSIGKCDEYLDAIFGGAGCSIRDAVSQRNPVGMANGGEWFDPGGGGGGNEKRLGFSPQHSFDFVHMIVAVK